MKRFVFCIFAMFFVTSVSGYALTPDEALKRLMEGNDRFVRETSSYPNWHQEYRTSLVDGQNPFAVVLACSDSRVPPEIMFDQGLGDIFVVRIAGNIIDDTEWESIQYAVVALNPSVILVVGHQNCGAVEAVLNNRAQGFPALEAAIAPGIKGISKADLDKAIKANVNHSMAQLKEKKEIQDGINKGSIKVFGAYADLSDGKVTLIN